MKFNIEIEDNKTTKRSTIVLSAVSLKRALIESFRRYARRYLIDYTCNGGKLELNDFCSGLLGLRVVGDIQQSINSEYNLKVYEVLN